MSFHARIAAALRNHVLQYALDRNAERRIQGRNRAFAELAEAEKVRDLGRAIRLETLKNLDRYLEQFAANVEKNGGRVHWAADADAARSTVIQIVCRAGGRAADRVLIAKSKSMLSEEIGLNEALTAAGAEVVETDLGEFIVQLRGEKPAHIITPAVHLRREDVSALFEKRFGMAPTGEVKDMTAVARAQLRRVFFGAAVGISGVNLGVAETGSVVLLTNEGNGRLVTSLPPVHIALMGIERLVPTMADLEVLLRLLPRSASAQKLTTYVTLLSGPRRPAEPDGPEEMHIVLVDNGRTRLLGGELAEALLCLRCGACLNICPVFRELGGHAYEAAYPGPIGAVIAAELCGACYGELAGASTLCGACREICPVRIDLPRMLLARRSAQIEAGRGAWWLGRGMRLFTWAMLSPARYAAAHKLAALITGLLARRGWVRALPPPLASWTTRRDFPAFAGETFRARWAKRRK